METSPDDEGLGSLSEETPQTPAACKGETEECLNGFGQGVEENAIFKLLFFLFLWKFIHGACN